LRGAYLEHLHGLVNGAGLEKLVVIGDPRHRQVIRQNDGCG